MLMYKNNKQLYNSKLWKDTRRLALRRDSYTCNRCYDRASEVHHIIPLDATNLNNIEVSLNLDNLECLCKSCHSKETVGATGDIDEQYEFNELGEVVKR